MCGLLRAQPFVTSATLESLLSRRRSRTPRLWRRRKLRQGAKFRITRFSNLYPRPILAGTIVWTSPTRAGLSHQPRRLRPVPTAAVRMSGAHTAQAQPLARQSQADCPRPQQASRSTPGQRRNPACQPRTQQEIADRKRRNHMRKMLILFKGAQPSTSPWCAWVNDPLEPDNSHPTGNHHPHHHTNSTTSHPSDALQSSAGRRTPSSAPSPGCSSSRCRAPDRETRTT